MTYSDVQTMLAQVDIPTAYYQFPDNTGIQPPFICFYYSGSRDVYADNQNYQKIEHLVVELYVREKDFTLESTLESALQSSGLTWTKEESYLDDQGMIVNVYDTDVIITDAINTEE
jgi:hypothetical protein